MYVPCGRTDVHTYTQYLIPLFQHLICNQNRQAQEFETTPTRSRLYTHLKGFNQFLAISINGK